MGGTLLLQEFSSTKLSTVCERVLALLEAFTYVCILLLNNRLEVNGNKREITR